VCTEFDVYVFIPPYRDGPHCVIGYDGRAGGRPHRFLHNNFSSVYRIFIKLGHMIPCGRGRTLYILGSLGQRSRSLIINIIFDNRVIST
jgi:hypothetical protein